MKPIIGVTPALEKDETTYMVHRAHGDAIVNAGGAPLILPYGFGVQIKQLAQTIDGLYLTGGDDIDPHYFKEEPQQHLGKVDPLRDRFEIELVQEIMSLEKPILGVCRGSQIMNVALGGTMYQDLVAEKNCTLIQHKQNRLLHYSSHFVEVKESSLLYDIVQKKRIKVNSNHHQANNQLGKDLQVAALSEDGVIEAIELRGKPFMLGVQWHPEQLLLRNDNCSQLIYTRFVHEARRLQGN